MKYRELIEEIEVPAGAQVQWNNDTLTVEWKETKVEKKLPVHDVVIRVENNKVYVQASRNDKKTLSRVNSLRTHVKNIFQGLEKGYEYKLAIVYAHFPMTVQVKGDRVEIGNYLGQKKVRKAQILPGTEVHIKGKEVIVRGNQKESAGQTAANIENATRISGKDRRVFQDGIYMVTKG